MPSRTVRSKWIETEIDRNGKLYLLPIRNRLEAKRGKLRTVIQVLTDGEWVHEHATRWVVSSKCHKLTQVQLDEAAQEIADSLIQTIASGPMHPDWEITYDAFE